MSERPLDVSAFEIEGDRDGVQESCVRLRIHSTTRHGRCIQFTGRSARLHSQIQSKHEMIGSIHIYQQMDRQSSPYMIFSLKLRLRGRVPGRVKFRWSRVQVFRLWGSRRERSHGDEYREEGEKGNGDVEEYAEVVHVPYGASHRPINIQSVVKVKATLPETMWTPLRLFHISKIACLLSRCGNLPIFPSSQRPPRPHASHLPLIQRHLSVNQDESDTLAPQFRLLERGHILDRLRVEKDEVGC